MDSITVSNLITEHIPVDTFPLPFYWRDIVDILTTLAMIVIAGINVWLLCKHHKENKALNATDKEKERKAALLKTLILDHQMTVFYKIFLDLDKELEKLKDKNCDKKALEPTIQKLFRNLNDKFIIYLSGIDETLYEDVNRSCDDCRDKLLENISNQGYNLYVPDMYKEHIEKLIIESKMNIIKTLYDFRG